MADQATSLPVRSEADGLDERVHVKVVDGVTPSQRMTVDTDLNAHVESHGNDPTGIDRALKTSELGNANTDGIYHAANNTIPSTNGLMAFLRAASPALSDLIKRVTAITNGSVHALDISLHDEDGAAYSPANPLPVVVSEQGAGVVEVTDYSTAAAVAAGGTSNHDYAVTATKTADLFRILASASGKMKIEVQTSPDGIAFSTIAVGFNSTANPNISLELSGITPDITGAGSTIRVIRKNLDNQSQDMYSTILAVERP